MKRWFLITVFLGVGVAMAMAAVIVLLRVTLRTPAVTSPFLSAAWVSGTLVLGVIALVGTVFLATRLAVFFFDHRNPPAG